MASSERYPRDVPPMWMLAAIGAMFALHFGWPVAQWLAPPWRNIGWLPIAIALPLAATSISGFRRAGTAVLPFAQPRALVVGGPFRWTRNPMYLSLVLIASGIALRLGSLTPLSVPPLLFLVLDRRFVRREEQFLRHHIGTPYDDYCRRVPRWLPRRPHSA